jgi:hypothetical protein
MYRSDEPSSQQGPRKVTARELVEFSNAKELPTSYLTYSFTKSIDTGFRINSARVGRQGETKTKYLLVQVKDRWMIAQVKPNFTGDQLEGVAQKWDSPLYNKIIANIVERYPAEAKHLLPYQFNAENDYVSESRFTNKSALFIAVLGVLCCFTGLAAILIRIAAARR